MGSKLSREPKLETRHNASIRMPHKGAAILWSCLGKNVVHFVVVTEGACMLLILSSDMSERGYMKRMEERHMFFE